MTHKIQKPDCPVNLLAEWHELLAPVPPGHVKTAYAQLLGWLLAEIDHAHLELVPCVRDGMRHVLRTVAEIYQPRDLVVLEIMPEHLRASHEAAHNYGQWPHNGARRFATDRTRAEMVCQADRTAEILEGEDPAGYEVLP